MYHVTVIVIYLNALQTLMNLFLQSLSKVCSISQKGGIAVQGG